MYSEIVLQNCRASIGSVNVDMARSPLLDEALGRTELHGATGLFSIPESIQSQFWWAGASMGQV